MYTTHFLLVINGELIKLLPTLFDGKGATALSNAVFGQGSGEIFLDDVNCAGNETLLLGCSSNPLGSHNCGHYEDASVRCPGNLLAQYSVQFSNHETSHLPTPLPVIFSTH